MKILLSTPFDFGYPGGVNDHLLHLERELNRLGHTTRILAPRTYLTQPDREGRIQRIGKSLPIPANGSIAHITLSPVLNGKVRRFLERERFDIIHLQEAVTSTLHMAVLHNSTSVNIGTFHAAHPSRVGANLVYIAGKPVFNHLINKLHARIAVSEMARGFISNYFPGDYQIVPNGIDFDQFGPDVAPIAGYASDEPTILFVGRFNESRKGFRYLLQALHIVQQTIPACRLLVVGPDDPEPAKALVQRLNLQNVIFAGHVPTEEIPHYYATCDVFCAPSTGQESFGIVLLEGMASQKPVVATDINGYRSVVRHEREALLVEPRNAAMLAKALLRVLNNADLAARLGEAGRRRSAIFSWHAIARQVVECYGEARQRKAEQHVPSVAPSSVFSSIRRP
jgi:phosphatidyl-myo-inositol alpha-mannosyltransferase